MQQLISLPHQNRGKNKMEITLLEAINLALTYEMTHDKEVIVFGEDVVKNGGVFRATVGLLDKFGP